MIDRVLSPAFTDAMVASGRTRSEIVEAAMHELTTCSPGYAKSLLCARHRLPHGSTATAVIAAVCRVINFPIERAFVEASTKPRVEDDQEEPGSIDERFERALAAVKAQRRRLTDEECFSVRGSIYGARNRKKERQLHEEEVKEAAEAKAAEPADAAQAAAAAEAAEAA